MRKKLSVWFLAAAAFITVVQAESLSFERYCNARFGFCVDYPSSLTMDPPPTNNDGRIFHGKHGFTMSASGMFNALYNTVQEEMRSQSSDFDKITYKRAKKHWFVLSGYSGGDILYIKTYVGKDYLYHLYLRYPVSMKKYYNQLISRISTSFEPGPLRDQ